MTKDKRVNCCFENQWGTYSFTLVHPPNPHINPHPTVVFAHGLWAQKEWYRWIGEGLASQGYLAMLITVPSKTCFDPRQWSDGLRTAIDRLLEEKSGNSPSGQESNVPRKIGVMGHSMGGLGALLAGREDPRVACIVGLAPAILPNTLSIPNDLSRLSIPVQLQIGSNDGIISPETVQAFVNELASKQKCFLEIVGGNHMRFLDQAVFSTIGEYVTRIGFLGRRLKDMKATITFEEQHNISQNGFIEWFDRYLK